jgi:hypothetical protein
MTTPKNSSSAPYASENDPDGFLAELERRGHIKRQPAPAKVPEETRPAAPAMPAAATAAPSAGLDQPAAEVCGRFPLGDAARSLLQKEQKTRAFLPALVEAKHFIDAVKVLAHALPKREGVWWACQCCRQDPAVVKAPQAQAALEAAERWAADPSEDNRRAASATAEAAGFGTPAGCASVAAFWSGGSLGPPTCPSFLPVSG